MGKPRKKPDAAPAEPVSFTEFATLLQPWFATDAWDRNSATYSSPRDAAAAAHAATCAYEGKRGTILIAATDSTDARKCFDYIKSFFSDVPALAQTVRKVGNDGLEVRSGIKIQVTSDDTKRPHALLAAIHLIPAARDPNKYTNREM